MRKIKYLIFFNLSRKSTKTNMVCCDRLAVISFRYPSSRLLKHSIVDQVARHLELAIELVGSVNQARNLGMVILFGSATS